MVATLLTVTALACSGVDAFGTAWVVGEGGDWDRTAPHGFVVRAAFALCGVLLVAAGLAVNRFGLHRPAWWAGPSGVLLAYCAPIGLMAWGIPGSGDLVARDAAQIRGLATADLALAALGLIGLAVATLSDVGRGPSDGRPADAVPTQVDALPVVSLLVSIAATPLVMLLVQLVTAASGPYGQGGAGWGAPLWGLLTLLLGAVAPAGLAAVAVAKTPEGHGQVFAIIALGISTLLVLVQVAMWLPL